MTNSIEKEKTSAVDTSLQEESGVYVHNKKVAGDTFVVTASNANVENSAINGDLVVGSVGPFFPLLLNKIEQDDGHGGQCVIVKDTVVITNRLDYPLSIHKKKLSQDMQQQSESVFATWGLQSRPSTVGTQFIGDNCRQRLIEEVLPLAIEQGKPGVIKQCLVGLNGVGKTRLASYYLDQVYKQESSNICKLLDSYQFLGWFTVTDDASLFNDFYYLAREIGLPVVFNEHSLSDIARQVWTRLAQLPRVLVVFDGVNASMTSLIRKLLPQDSLFKDKGNTCHCLITTDHQGWDKSFEQHLVQPWREKAALRYFYHHLKDSSKAKQALVIIDSGDKTEKTLWKRVSFKALPEYAEEKESAQSLIAQLGGHLLLVASLVKYLNESPHLSFKEYSRYFARSSEKVLCIQDKVTFYHSTVEELWAVWTKRLRDLCETASEVEVGDAIIGFFKACMEKDDVAAAKAAFINTRGDNALTRSFCVDAEDALFKAGFMQKMCGALTVSPALRLYWKLKGKNSFVNETSISMDSDEPSYIVSLGIKR